MGIILSALAAAGDSVVKSIDSNIEQQNRLDLEDQRSQLETQKYLAIARATNSLNNQPLNDFAAAVAARQNGMVPMAPPAPATQTNGILDRGSMMGADGNPIQSAGVGDVGLSGNIAALRAQISNSTSMSDEEKSGALAQLDAQAAQQNQAAAAATPTTRKVTPSEAQDLAMQDLLASGNGAAYAAGRPLLVDKTLSVADGAALIDPRTGKVLFQNTGKEDRQDKREDRKDDRLTATQQYIADRQDKSIAAAIDAASGKREAATTLTPGMDVNARAIANGQLAPITGYGLRSPGAAAIMARVLEINPDYSAKDYLVNTKSEKDFATGKQGNSVRSFNVAIAHLDTLSSLSDALNNGDLQLINKMGNAYASQTGGTAPVNFEAAKNIVSDEIVKAVTGSAGALGDREAAAKTVNSANSPAQLKGVINTYKELMNGQLNGLRDQYKATTGRDDFDTKYLSDAARSMNHSGARTGVSPASIGMPLDVTDLLKKYGGN